MQITSHTSLALNIKPFSNPVDSPRWEGGGVLKGSKIVKIDDVKANFRLPESLNFVYPRLLRVPRS